jgi:uncharacterized protein (TIGR03032 family)
MLDAPQRSVSCDDGFLHALQRSGCTLAATLAPGGLSLIGVEPDEASLCVEFLPLQSAWGLAALNQKIAVATRRQVIVLSDAGPVATTNPDRPNYYEAYYSPRMTFFTGECSIHDLAITKRGLLGANTRFSNVSLIDGQYSFSPVWKPRFISAITAEDRCHLNGLAADENGIRYVTAFGCFDAPQEWRNHPPASGVLIDAPSNEVLCGGLCLPHSPSLISDRLFVLESGTGRVLDVDRASGKSTVVIELPGFVRGLTSCNDVSFVGLSDVRHTQRGASLPVAKNRQLAAGIAAIDNVSGTLLGMLRIGGQAREVFALATIPGRRAGLADGIVQNQRYLVEGRVVTQWLRVGSLDHDAT